MYKYVNIDYKAKIIIRYCVILSYFVVMTINLSPAWVYILSILFEYSRSI